MVIVQVIEFHVRVGWVICLCDDCRSWGRAVACDVRPCAVAAESVASSWRIPSCPVVKMHVPVGVVHHVDDAELGARIYLVAVLLDVAAQKRGCAIHHQDEEESYSKNIPDRELA